MSNTGICSQYGFQEGTFLSLLHLVPRDRSHRGCCTATRGMELVEWAFATTPAFSND
jgi:hypothetical protein